MDYLMHFTVRGLQDAERTVLMKKRLLDIEGVKDVQITGVDRVSVTYDPTVVIPSQLTAAMRATGIRTHTG